MAITRVQAAKTGSAKTLPAMSIARFQNGTRFGAESAAQTNATASLAPRSFAAAGALSRVIGDRAPKCIILWSLLRQAGN
jgi:hypothetical protein